MKRRWDYWERAVLVSIALIGLMLLGIVALSAWAGHRLEEQIAALRAAGEPTTLGDLARLPIPPETNGAVYLSDATTDLQTVLAELYDEAYLKLAAGRDSCDELPAEPERIRTVFATKPELFGLLEQAASCPDYDPDSTGSAGYSGMDGWGASTIRMAAEFLCARAQAQLAAGQRDEAMHSYIVVFRIARLADHRPGLIGELVAAAIVSLAVPQAEKVLHGRPYFAVGTGSSRINTRGPRFERNHAAIAAGGSCRRVGLDVRKGAGAGNCRQTVLGQGS